MLCFVSLARNANPAKSEFVEAGFFRDKAMRPGKRLQAVGKVWTAEKKALALFERFKGNSVQIFPFPFKFEFDFRWIF